MCPPTSETKPAALASSDITWVNRPLGVHIRYDLLRTVPEYDCPPSPLPCRSAFTLVMLFRTRVHLCHHHMLSLHLRIRSFRNRQTALRNAFLNSGPLPCFGTVAFTLDANRTQVDMNHTRVLRFKWTRVRINER